ncbi:helix-turn-helix domain-containing protein [Streptomyces cylindrosporus]|uniref:Helix-turn-helix domain-containing protein n=1 Tax=Streptomyces cylindrosporus TaxID=2927583 RepID=A0ABS9Y2F4_9ACTN|nr:helix-turn-helix transcriptional regulator [Streptomyces cylindrosporus]MCI3271378.1 helix-turn-helix domain-containing protein [Streptomyces cylindrosporus]
MPAKDQPTWVLDRRRALGDRITELRVARNLVQDQAIELTGIPRTTYQRLERGQADARYSHLLAIARAFEVDVTELVR